MSCWEQIIGSQFYKLALFDFFASIIGAFIQVQFCSDEDLKMVSVRPPVRRSVMLFGLVGATSPVNVALFCRDADNSLNKIFFSYHANIGVDFEILSVKIGEMYSNRGSRF